MAGNVFVSQVNYTEFLRKKIQRLDSFTISLKKLIVLTISIYFRAERCWEVRNRSSMVNQGISDFTPNSQTFTQEKWISLEWKGWSHSPCMRTHFMGVFFSFKRHSSNALWIGLNDLVTESSYQWSDGSPVVYINYGWKEPNDYYGQEDCLEIVKRGYWNDHHCSVLRPFICKTTNSEFPSCHKLSLYGGFRHKVENLNRICKWFLSWTTHRLFIGHLKSPSLA